MIRTRKATQRGHANHGWDTQTLRDDSEVSRRRSRLCDDGLQERNIQSNCLGRSEVLRDENPAALKAAARLE